METAIKIPKRPSKNDDFVLLAAAETLAPLVAKWADEPESEIPEIAKQIADSIRYGEDGYEIAKTLESRFCYDSDSTLVEILDNAMFHISNAHQRICKDWVKAYNPPKPVLESYVTCSSHKDAGAGIVTRISDDGTATVCFQSKGHVREGMGTHGFICNWEDLTPV